VGSRAIPLTILVASGMLATNACQQELVPPAPDIPAFLAARPECPHAWIWPADSTQQHSGLHNALIGNVGLVRETINAPEFNDCQRFIVPEGGGFAYREFYAIWASSRLSHLVADLTEVTVGRLDSIGLRPPSMGPLGPAIAEPPPLVPPVNSNFAVAVAEIYAEGRYDPLGILPWLNCLYVYRMSDQWRARMVPAGHSDVNCARIALTPTTDVPSGTDLQVIATTFPEFRMESDYPPVARWDWDATNQQQYIGVKCGAAWCEVGAQGFRTSQPLPQTAADPRGVRRVRLIKGWYDQQHLADEAPGQPRPTGIIGTIMPDSMLGRRDRIADFNGYVHAADIVLIKQNSSDDAALGRYRTKFGLSEATFTNPNQMFLCVGVRCGPVGAESAVSCAAGADWRARVVAAIPGGTPSVLKCIRRREATDYFVPAFSAGAVTPPTIVVPGTARWRWLAKDEGSWMRCLNGCCDTEL